MAYLIRNCELADFGTLATARRDLLIEGERIAEIGESITPPAGCEVIDARGMLALPAFVDAHAHMAQSFLKGLMDDFDITRWLIRLFGIQAQMTEEEYYYSVLLGCLQSLRFGVTTVNDMAPVRYIDAGVQAMRDAGIRATVGPIAADIAENSRTPLMSVDEGLRIVDDVYRRFHGLDGGRIRASAAPPGLPACSGELMRALKGYADERGLVFHCHLAEGRKETIDVARRTGLRGECEAMYELGLLDSNTLLAHCIWLEDFELDLIRETGAHPVHCPSTNLKISDGIPKIQRMLELGIDVAMGCDGEASSSNRDMLREACLGAYLQKGVTLNSAAMGARETYRMMTAAGARALSYDDLGEIKVGNRADIALVDTGGDPALANRQAVLSNLLYAGSGRNVDTVFTDGVPIVIGGQHQRVDTGAALEKSEALLRRITALAAEM